MMRPHVLLSLPLSAALALVAARAGASIPGNIDQRGLAGLVHVCQADAEPGDADYVPCVQHESDDPQLPFTAVECGPAGLDPVCVVDFIPKVRIKGTLFLINDDDAEDSGGFFQPEAGFVLELKLHGKKVKLVELFDGTTIGNWNGFSESFLVNVANAIDFKNPTGTEFQFASDNLSTIGEQIRQAAAAAFPKADLSAAVPVVTSIERDPKSPPLDASGNTLASAATFKVVIEFARTVP